MRRFFFILVTLCACHSAYGQNIDSLFKTDLLNEAQFDSLLFDARSQHGFVLTVDYISRSLYYGYTPLRANGKPLLQAGRDLALRYTFKNGIYLESGLMSLKPDNVFISLWDIYAGWNYKIIKDKLDGYLQYGHYDYNANTSNLRSALNNGFEGSMQYSNPIVNVKSTVSYDFSTAKLYDFYTGLDLSHDFYVLYDLQQGVLALSPSNDVYFGDIRTSNVTKKALQALKKQYNTRKDRTAYLQHLNQLIVNTGFGYLYNLAEVTTTYERQYWELALALGYVVPDKGSPLPQTTGVDRFIVSGTFGVVF